MIACSEDCEARAYISDVLLDVSEVCILPGTFAHYGVEFTDQLPGWRGL